MIDPLVIKNSSAAPTRRAFIAGAGATVMLPTSHANALAPLFFAVVRFGIGALARGTVRRGAVASLALSSTGASRAFAASAPRVSAAANLTQIARRTPSKFSRIRAEREAYDARYNSSFAAVGRYEARRAAQFADIALDGYEAMENIRTITSSEVHQKIGDERDPLIETISAYFLTLNYDNSAAAKTYWINAPTSSSAFRAIDARWKSSYKIYNLEVLDRNDAYADVYVHVDGQNNNDSWIHYDTVFHMASTEFGWQIVRQRSV